MVSARRKLREVVGAVRGCEQKRISRRIPKAVIVEIEIHPCALDGSVKSERIINAISNEILKLPPADRRTLIGNARERAGDRRGVNNAVVDDVLEGVPDVHRGRGGVDEAAVGIEGDKALGGLADESG